MSIKEQIDVTANCLLGICCDWGVDDVKEHLEWLIQFPDEIADGYPVGIINEDNKEDILNSVKTQL